MPVQTCNGVVDILVADEAEAVGTDGSDKGARFIQLCDSYDFPVVNLCDTSLLYGFGSTGRGGA